MGKLFSYENRPVHLGPYALEKLDRTDQSPDLSSLKAMKALTFRRPDAPLSIVNAMGEYQAMMDAIREGLVSKTRATIPSDALKRSEHLKAFGYFCDASMVGACEIPKAAWLDEALVNPDVERLAEALRTRQVKSLASGIDVIMANLKEAMREPPGHCDSHTHALVFAYEYPRDPQADEPGCAWIGDAQAQRAALRASETACVLANYLRSLGWEARAHSASASDVHLPALSVAAGLTTILDGEPVNPFLGTRFNLGVVTTNLELAPDRPLKPGQVRPPARARIHLSRHNSTAKPSEAYRKRLFKDGAHPYETIARVSEPTTYIDEANVARVPKRADMFARSVFGDLGKPVQEAAKNGGYVRKNPASFAFRSALGAFVLLQDGEAAPEIHPSTADPQANADNIKAACYFLGVDAVGISRCPDWVYYSHDARGEPLKPYHNQAISFVIDQGHETMEGASGDDWISCAQSMRAYLRFSLLGGVVAQQIRNLGYSAMVHTVMASEVVQPPLMLLSGLGEVSRIGEVILNPFLGPRLKAGTVTTSMPLSHDKPIDFGLQKFCEQCNKCARECPSGAITAGPKLMFNGYEIWKSDSQRCTTYRITTEGGAMCGRCMKTCPWNLEGLFAEAPFRWAAMNLPSTARFLARLDDAAGRGEVNPVKKWWWDIEMRDESPYRPAAKPVNTRALSKSLKLKYEDQTLAVYPAHLLPPPYPWPAPMDREQAIKAYQNMISADEYKRRRQAGVAPEHSYSYQPGDEPVLQVVLSEVTPMAQGVSRFRFSKPDGSELPPFEAGAHIDVVVAPEFFRQYSLCSDPAERNYYDVAVLREDAGRGGSALMHRIFEQGRLLFISKPINHFPLDESATLTYLMGGGIGITPMIAMAHRLHAINADFVVHYSVTSRSRAGFLDQLSRQPWSNRVHYHISEEGTRAQLSEILHYREGAHVYTCGPDAYMQAVVTAATENGFPEAARHLEYFSVPEEPEYENHDFTLQLTKAGLEFQIPADRAATEVLLDAGVHVDVKCSDGLCGVCKCELVSGEVEHRDFVLSQKERETSIILCRSRAADPDGVLKIAL